MQNKVSGSLSKLQLQKNKIAENLGQLLEYNIWMKNDLTNNVTMRKRS